MQALVIVIGLAAYYCAVVLRPNLVVILLTAYAFIDQLAPPVYAALYWKRATTPGVLAGLAAGMITAIVFVIWPGLRPFDIHEGVLGLLANIGVLVAVSLATPRQDEPHIAAFTAGSAAD